MEPSHHLTFGPFCLDVTHGRLWRGGQPMALCDTPPGPRAPCPVGEARSASGKAWCTSTSRDGIFVDADGSYQGLKDFASRIVFGESQPVVRDLAEWITRRPCSGPVSQVLFYQKRSIFI